MSCLNEQEFKTVENMDKHGGSFVKALANCFHHADHINKEKLKETFSDYWAMYSPAKWDEKLADQADKDYKESQFSGDAYLN